MGEVFRAVAVGDHGFEKPVVVKRLLPVHASRSDFAALFVAEAKLMTRLAHPNIVEVLDFGRGEGGEYYLVLELVEGADLGRMMRAASARGDRFSTPLALFVAARVLRGLHHAHTRLAEDGSVVVHRDVSPSNVLCSMEGEVKVADFGVALVRQVGDATSASVMGKPGYMAPEQLTGAALDARADVFSVGVLLHQMLAGERPFRDEQAARAGERTPLLQIRDDVPPSVDGILARALAPRREDRWPDARAMAHAIERLADEGQPLATGDDVADAVRRACRETPGTSRPVIALSASPADVRDAADSNDALPQLTRTSVIDGLGAFAVRPVEPRTERIASPSALDLDLPTTEPPKPGGAQVVVAPSASPAPAHRRAVLLGLGVLVAAMSALGVTTFERTPVERRATPSAASLPPPIPPRVRDLPRPTAPIETTAPSASAPPPHATAAPRAPPTPVSTIPPPASAALAAAPACVGEVAFASDGSWVVGGGPAQIQTPAIVRWPCGTYAVTARARFDPAQEKAATVTVAAGQRATVDLRR